MTSLIQSCIDHIKTSIDIDPWAAELAEKALRQYEPRVMTLEEALNSLVIEYRSGKLREVGKHVFAEGAEYYGSIWRVWDKMPTDEQREKEPWDDAER